MARRTRIRAVVAGLAGLVTTAGTVVVLGVAHAAPVRHEAESASCDGTIDSNHAGFSGSGFCNSDNEVGAAVQFSVSASAAGSATVTVRYANGTTANRPADVVVNGAVAQPAVGFGPTGAWTNWVTTTVPVPVPAGGSTIRLVATTSAGLANIDYLEFDVAGGASQARYEAEAPPATCQGDIESEHAGFSGTGYCNSDNAAGATVRFTVSTAAAGAATVGIRFANGTASARPASVQVNGSTVASTSFESTGAWTSWVTKRLTVQLAAGSNTIGLVATGSAGLPNVDFLDGPAGGTPPTTSPPPQTSPPPGGDVLIVAPNGSDNAPGTEANPTTLTSAISRIAPGGTILMRGGTYNFSQTVFIQPDNNGTANNRTELFAFPGETPVLNFSAQSENSANRGLAIGGSFWHIRGIVVERAGDNGILLGGHNNIIERVVTRFNRDTGLQISRFTAGAPRDQWPSNNLVVSSVSHDNADSDGEDADGFAPKLTVGPGNVLRYTVSHNNIDDGYDLFTSDDDGTISPVTIEHSLAFENGTLSDGSQAGDGDRNGFKLGGEDFPVNHIIRGNFGVDNGQHGFTYNRNPGTMTVSNNVSIDSAERNFNFDAGTSVFRNNTSCRFDGGGDNDRIVGDADGSNQFWSGSNGSRCSMFSGPLGWSFDADGRLIVTFGGVPVTP
ncbi:MAG TPA: carbohydrate-binding protein [Natronosporangium sp.]